MKRWIPLAMVVLFVVASPVHAQDPTPTPMPRYEDFGFGELPTETLNYSNTINTEIMELYPITSTVGITLDLGLWEYPNFVTVIRIANTVKSLGNKYHIWDMLAGIAIVGLAIGPLVAMIRARGQGGGD